MYITLQLVDAFKQVRMEGIQGELLSLKEVEVYVLI